MLQDTLRQPTFKLLVVYTQVQLTESSARRSEASYRVRWDSVKDLPMPVSNQNFACISVGDGLMVSYQWLYFGMMQAAHQILSVNA